MKKLLTAVLLAIGLAVLPGCGSVGVQGQRVDVQGGAGAAAPKNIGRFAIYYQIGSFTDGDYTTLYLANWHMNELFPIMAQRLPEVFKANGLKIPYTRSSTGSGAGPLPTEIECCEYVMRIRPDSYSHDSRGAQHFKIAADIYSRNTGPIWSGNMFVHSGIVGDGFFGKMTDKLLAELLTRLNADGIISTGPVQIPDVALAPLPSIRAFHLVPGLDEVGKKGYRDFLQAPSPRAFAISPHGGWAAAAGTKVDDPAEPTDPKTRALKNCAKSSKEPCRAYAVDDAVVWRGF